jgi:hypothetical protein
LYEQILELLVKFLCFGGKDVSLVGLFVANAMYGYRSDGR